MSLIRKVFLPLLLIAGFASPAKAAIIELSLVVDASGSINTTEFSLQVDAYESIFSNNFFDTFVNPGDELYVNLVLFASSAVERIGYTAITDNAAAAAFGAAVGAVSRSGIGSGTDTQEATDLAVSLILGNGIAADRSIIDVSTDGVPNSTTGAINSATAAAAAGVTVNAIGVGSGIGATFLTNFTNAGGGFFETAANFTEFDTALRRKLTREITTPTPPPPTGVPEPSALILLALGLGALGFRTKRRT